MLSKKNLAIAMKLGAYFGLAVLGFALFRSKKAADAANTNFFTSLKSELKVLFTA